MEIPKYKNVMNDFKVILVSDVIFIMKRKKANWILSARLNGISLKLE